MTPAALLYQRTFGQHVGDYEANAAYITLLRDHEKMLIEQRDALQTEYNKLYAAYHYMQQLIDLMKANPVLLDEWLNLLETIGLEPPEWIDECRE